MYKEGFDPKTLEVRRKHFTGTSYHDFFRRGERQAKLGIGNNRNYAQIGA